MRLASQLQLVQHSVPAHTTCTKMMHFVLGFVQCKVRPITAGTHTPRTGSRKSTQVTTRTRVKYRYSHIAHYHLSEGQPIGYHQLASEQEKHVKTAVARHTAIKKKKKRRTYTTYDSNGCNAQATQSARSCALTATRQRAIGIHSYTNTSRKQLWENQRVITVWYQCTQQMRHAQTK